MKLDAIRETRETLEPFSILNGSRSDEAGRP